MRRGTSDTEGSGTRATARDADLETVARATDDVDEPAFEAEPLKS